MTAYDTSTNMAPIDAEVHASDRHIDGRVGPRATDGSMAFAYPEFAVTYGSSYGQPAGWEATVSRSGSGSKSPTLARHYAKAELLAAEIAEAILAEITAHGVTRTETYEEAVALTERMQAVANSVLGSVPISQR